MRMFAPAAAALALTLPAVAQDEPEGAPSPNAIVDAAEPDEWVPIPADDLLVMKLAPDAAGNERRVVIQLMPAPFSQGWVSNIKTLARANWYDGITVNRVQDNYVVQWGDPGHDNPESGDTEAKPLPEGLTVVSESDYVVDGDVVSDYTFGPIGTYPDGSVPSAADILDAKRSEAWDFGQISIDATKTESAPEGWHERDNYAQWVEFWKGWPLANYEVYYWVNASGERRNTSPPLSEWAEWTPDLNPPGEEKSEYWPIHCYGMVGVGRSYSPDTGSGAELYTVIGQAPRHLDRNIALVGRIIAGMEHLTSLPRGSGALGFYTEEEKDKRTPILSIRVASDLSRDQQPRYEFLHSYSKSFEQYVAARANRRDPFFIVPAGGVDICNVPVPVREVAAENAE